MENKETPKPLIIFIMITFAFSICFSALVGVTGGTESRFASLGLIAMFFPWLAVLIMKFVFKAPLPDAGWKRFPVKWIPAALFIMPIAIHVVCLSVVAVSNDGTLPWQAWLTPDKDGLYHAPPERNWGILTTSGLISRILQNAIIGILLVSILAFFEEIGWRAWMLPRLVNRFNLRAAVLVSSLIWALWHVPFVLGGIHHIEGTPMVALLLLNPLGHIGAGNVLAWLWIRTRSIWIISLAHGALNNWGQYAFKYMSSSPEGPVITLLIALNLTLFIVGAVFLLRLKHQDEIK